MRVYQLLTFFRRTAAGYRRYAHNECGVTAIEFGLVAAPFFYLLIGIFEVAAMFVANVMLDHGTIEATRQIRTLELQKSGGSASDFKQLVCDNTYGMLDCASRMYVDVNTYNNFSAANPGVPIVNGNLNAASLNFLPGTGGSIVVARVFYEWQIVTPFFGNIWGNLGGNQRLLQSATAFRNEPS